MSRGKRVKNRKRSFSRFIITIFELVCIGVMIYSGTKIFLWIKDNNDSKKQISELAESITVISNDNEISDANNYDVDFAELKSKNDDIVGYLKLKGIDIEYPVVKSTNNEYYLSHSFDKSYNGAGWIFTDYRNKIDGTDKNLIIYGHNRRDGSMFGNLKIALTEEWYSVEENRKIIFITEAEKSTYQVFSVYKIAVEDYYITTDFNGDEYDKFLETIKNRSIFNFNTELNSEDKILTLSTCDNNNKFRVVVHAKKIVNPE